MNRVVALLMISLLIASSVVMAQNTEEDPFSVLSNEEIAAISSQSGSTSTGVQSGTTSPTAGGAGAQSSTSSTNKKPGTKTAPENEVRQCQGRYDKATQAGAQVADKPFGTDNINKCGTNKGCKAFKTEFDNQNCDSCKYEDPTKNCVGGGPSCLSAQPTSPTPDPCKKLCYEDAVKKADEKGKTDQDQLKKDLPKGGESCKEVPIEELQKDDPENCQQFAGLGDKAKSLSEEIAKARQDVIDKAKAALAKQAAAKAGTAAASAAGQKRARAQTSSSTTKDVLNGVVTVGNTLNAAKGFQAVLSSGKVILDVHPATTDSITAAVSAQPGSKAPSSAGVISADKLGKECWGDDQMDIMDEKYKQQITNPEKLKQMADRGWKGFTQEQMYIGGQNYGDSFIADTTGARGGLTSKQVLSWKTGTESAGKSLTFSNFDRGVRTDIANYMAGKPGNLGNDPKTASGATSGNQNSMSSMLQQGAQLSGILSGVAGILGALKSNKQPQTAATSTNYVAPSTTPAASSIQPNSLVVDPSLARLCGKSLTFSKGYQCTTSAGTTISASAGNTGVTASGTLVANPIVGVQNNADKTLVASVASPDTLSSASTTAAIYQESDIPPTNSRSPMTITMVPGAGGVFSIGERGSIKGLDVITGSAVGDSMRMTVDLTEHTVLFDSDTLTQTRMPYDSTADKAPLFHYISGEPLDIGESYPPYRADAPKGEKKLAYRVTFFDSMARDPTDSETTIGLLTQDWVQIIPNNDERIDLWAGSSFLSTVIQTNVIRGLSNMVDPHNLDIITIRNYFMDGKADYDYLVSNGDVFIARGQGAGKIIESSAGVPPDSIPVTQKQIVYR